jgi:hypothetical protein
MSDPHSSPDSEESSIAYTATRRLADIFFELVEPYKDGGDRWIWTEDWRRQSVNPFFSQTSQGLYLEYYYGHPSSIWTPWGTWHFVGSCGWPSGVTWDRLLQPAFDERVGLTMFRPEKVTDMGHFGPTYAVGAVEDIRLPEPALRLEHKDFIPYAEVKEIWQVLTERHTASGTSR